MPYTSRSVLTRLNHTKTVEYEAGVLLACFSLQSISLENEMTWDYENEMASLQACERCGSVVSSPKCILHSWNIFCSANRF